MFNGLAKLFVSPDCDCAITPPTVKSSTIVTSSVKSIVIAEVPGAPDTFTLPVVPIKLTASVDPSLPVNVIIPVVGAAGAIVPAVTGNVYVVSKPPTKFATVIALFSVSLRSYIRSSSSAAGVAPKFV